MTKIKGYTVHADDGRGQGYGVCGTKAREFMGIRGVTTDPRRVTCPKCEKIGGQTRADHACDACGGRGYGPCATRETVQPAGYSPGGVCLVCLGAGRISDRMPARDAIADAETLRRNANLWWREWNIDRGPIESIGATVSHWSPEISYTSGQAGARAAFRAVPGLRGE